jgi:hypothetical protein
MSDENPKVEIDTTLVGDALVCGQHWIHCG